MNHPARVTQIMKDYYRLTPNERTSVKHLILEYTTPPSSTPSSRPLHENQTNLPVALDIEYIYPSGTLISYPIIHSLAVVDANYRLPIFMIADRSITPFFRRPQEFARIDSWVTTHNTHFSSITEMRNMIINVVRHHDVIMWDSEKDINLMNLHDFKDNIYDISPYFLKSNGHRCGLRATHKYFFGFDPMLSRDPRASAEAIMRLYREAQWEPGQTFDLIETNRQLDRAATEPVEDNSTV